MWFQRGGDSEVGWKQSYKMSKLVLALSLISLHLSDITVLLETYEKN